MQANYIAPQYELTNFNCPYCNAFAHQQSYKLLQQRGIQYYDVPNDAKITFCYSCKKSSFWIDRQMVYPKLVTQPIAHYDMPENVKELYNEARLVCELSPRSAATLLRVSLERLVEYLGFKTGNLNQRISNLKSKGLSEKIINSLDIVRIYGNDGAHNNEMNMDGKDSSEIVNKLFWLVNVIVEKVITEPKVIDGIYLQLPETKKDAIGNRDRIK